MQIRSEQMEALDHEAQRRFHLRLVKFLRDQLPEETVEISDDVLLARIIEAEHRANKYDIVTEIGITQFVLLGFLAGPDFDEEPDVHTFLSNPAYEPDEKIDALVDELLELEEESEG
jgi:hypothetical protein